MTQWHPGDPLPEDHSQTNLYECPKCQYEWKEQWSCGCDSECPNCGLENIQITDSFNNPKCGCASCQHDKGEI